MLSRVLILAVASLSFAGLMPSPAQAATVLTGPHDNNPADPGDGDGYDAAAPGPYVVPVDVGGTPSATFNNNSADGLSIDGGTTVQINGGQFNNNTYGVDAYTNGSSVTITGGTFNSSNANSLGVYIYGGTLNISGGTFDNGYGLWAQSGSTVSITGGAFSNSNADFYLYHGLKSFDVYGQFDGMSVGQTQALTVTSSNQSFTGTLLNETTPQTFSYRGDTIGGAPTITLHDVAVPEPALMALLGGLSILGLARRKRRE